MNETPVHSYSFEAWPDPMPAASYPMLVPDRVAVTADSHDTARQLAGQTLKPGQALGACSHWRSRCTPPHPGRN